MLICFISMTSKTLDNRMHLDSFVRAAAVNVHTKLGSYNESLYEFCAFKPPILLSSMSYLLFNYILSHDVASGSDILITP